MFDTLRKKTTDFLNSSSPDPRQILTYGNKVRSFLNSDTSPEEQQQPVRTTKKQSYNPFLNRNGELFNPYINYQALLDSPKVNDTVKSYITNATGLSPFNQLGVQSNGMVGSTAMSDSDSGSVGAMKNFSGISANQLAQMDVANELPKLSSNQIAKLINTHFKNSSAITEKDAAGIEKAQNNTGMSALAILGIAALESGWGTSNIAKNKNNFWGWNATNINPATNAKTYSRIGEGGAEQYAKQYMDLYYNQRGSKSIWSTGTGNNPAKKGYAYFNNGGINSGWATDVGNIMNKMFQTLGYSGYTGGKTGGTSGENSIVSAAKKYLGTPYLWGGKSLKAGGLDCSGFVEVVMRENGKQVTGQARSQFRQGTPVDKNSLQPGDVVFFKGYTKSATNPGHVGIYIGNGEYIHAPKSGDVVKISKLSGRSDYVGAKRMI